MKTKYTYAIRITIGILGILGAIALFYLSSGVLVIETLFETETSEYIKYEIISGLWLLYGLTNIIFYKNRISSIIAGVLSAITTIICLTNINEYKNVFIVSLILFLIAISSLFLRSDVSSIKFKH